MNVNATVLQLAFIFLPGVLCAGIVDKLTIHKPRTAFEFSLRSFVFGIACYVVYFLILWVGFGVEHHIAQLNSQPNLAHMREISIIDITGATAISLLLGIAWSASVNHKILMRMMQATKVTRKYGDENIWDFTLNLNIPSVEYAYVRDFSKGMVYSGWIKAFSDGMSRRVLLMENVEVFDLESANMLFETPLLYISFSDDNFNVEFPYRPDR